MEMAHSAIVDAVSAERFLTMLTIHCKEFRLQSARIARRQQCWGDMHKHVHKARDMTVDRAPLCTLHSGQAVYYSTICDYISEFEPLCEHERTYLRELADESDRLRLFNRFVRQLVNIPNIVIQYP
jgi:hypothetical protein